MRRNRVTTGRLPTGRLPTGRLPTGPRISGPRISGPLLAVALLAPAAAACSPFGSAEDDVSDTMTGFVQAAREGDAREACGHMAKVYRDAGCEQGWSDDAVLKDLGRATFKVGAVDGKAGEATVSVTLPDDGGRRRTTTWKLVKDEDEGAWRIAVIG